jgi:hypothetical protein
MHALVIERNGKVLLVAGTPDPLMLSLHLTAVVDGEHPASLHIGGVKDLGGAQKSRTLWLSNLPIGLGDELRIGLRSIADSIAALIRSSTVLSLSRQEQALLWSFVAELLVDAASARLESISESEARAARTLVDAEGRGCPSNRCAARWYRLTRVNCTPPQGNRNQSTNNTAYALRSMGLLHRFRHHGA